MRVRGYLLLGLLATMLFGHAGLAGAAPAPAAASDHALNAASYAPTSEACAFLGLINSYRAGNGLGALALSATLGSAAEFHASDMASKDYFSHTLASGKTWSQNIADHGYPVDSERGENIAAGNGAASDTFDQWKGSPSHNANMLDKGYKAIGIGRAYGETSTYGWYWTTTFGSVVDAKVTCPGDDSAPANPPGAKQAPGGPYTVASVGRTKASTSGLLAVDGKTDTEWHTTATSAPRSAYISFDLGSAKPIAKIEWLFTKTGAADSFQIQVSTDKQTWTTISTRGNAKSAKSWQSFAWAGTARYVRFTFANPNKDAVLGYLGEVKISG